jgi:alkylhydroperoxidase/carboxymuconolactone decarboxylase family protein YurZ
MKVPSGAPRRYRIVFRGECGDAFAGLFGDAAVQSSHGYTCAVASVRDVSEFYGLLDRFEDLALEPVSISEISPYAEAATLDARSRALVRLAALAACGGEPSAVSEQAMTAVRHGVSPEEIAGTLTVLVPAIGAGRLAAAAAAIRHVLGEGQEPAPNGKAPPIAPAMGGAFSPLRRD